MKGKKSRVILVIMGKYIHEHGQGYILLPEGKDEMNRVAEKIQNELKEGEEAIILSANSRVAEDSAKILHQTFMDSFALSYDCFIDASDFSKACRLIKETAEKNDVIIIVCHPNFAGFVNYFINVRGEISSQSGATYLIDKESRQVTILF